jgi:hypothetical protein
MRTQQQQAQLAVQQAQREDAMRQKLSAIKPPGTSTVEQAGPMPDGSNIPAQTVTRSQGDVLRDQAAAIGQTNPVESAKLYEAARQNDYQDAIDQIHAKNQATAQRIIADPAFAQEWGMTHGLDYLNSNNVNGHTYTPQSLPGGAVGITVTDANGNVVGTHQLAPQDIQKQALRALELQHLHELQMADDPRNYDKYATTGANLELTGAREGLMGAQAKAADATARYHDAEATVGVPARAQYFKDEGAARLGMLGVARDRAAQEKMGPLTQLGVDADDHPVFGYLLNGKNGPSVQQVNLPPGVKSTRKVGTPDIDSQVKSTFMQEYSALPTSGAKRTQALADLDAKYPGVRKALKLDTGTSPIADIAAALNKKGGPGAKPAAAAGKGAGAPTAKTAPKDDGSDDPIRGATDAQLWDAVQSTDPLQKQFATEELRRRGLLASEDLGLRRGGRNFIDAGN